MSDGMRDSRVLESLETEVEKAASLLCRAIKDAQAGHRGLALCDLEEIVNPMLAETGYKLKKTRGRK